VTDTPEDPPAFNTADYLSARQCAALAGVKLATWWGYVNRAQAPPADVRWLNRDLWHREKFAAWLTARDARKAARRPAPEEKP